MEPDHLAREAGQHWRESGEACEVRHLPAGGGGGAPPDVRGDSGADRPAAAGVCLEVTFVAPDKRVQTSSPGVQGAPGWPISGVRKGAAYCAAG